MLDFSMLRHDKRKLCVRCYNEEDARVFVEEMRRQHPGRCSWWDPGETHWRFGDEHVDYFPYLNDIDGHDLCWDRDGYAERNGYYIVNFSDIPRLFPVTDLGDMPQSDISICELLV